MIPMVAVVQFRRGSMPGFRLWLPLFLLWLLLLPVFIIVLPFFFIACLVTWLNPFRALKIFFEILRAFKGTEIEVDNPQQKIMIKIR